MTDFTLLDSDVELLVAMARGDRSAFGELYTRYAPLLRRAGRRVVDNAADAEDLLHDVMLEAWTSAAKFDPDRGSVRLWLLLRLRSRGIDRRRSGWATRSVPWLAERDENIAVVDDAAAAGLERDRVQRALNVLSPSHRATVGLVYFEGRGMDEAGDILVVPSGTVKSRLNAARARLRLELE